MYNSCNVVNQSHRQLSHTTWNFFFDMFLIAEFASEFMMRSNIARARLELEQRLSYNSFREFKSYNRRQEVFSRRRRVYSSTIVVQSPGRTVRVSHEAPGGLRKASSLLKRRS